jgi:hypothetical protein
MDTIMTDNRIQALETKLRRAGHAFEATQLDIDATVETFGVRIGPEGIPCDDIERRFSYIFPDAIAIDCEAFETHYILTLLFSRSRLC